MSMVTAAEVDATHIAEVEALVKDIRDNLSDYMSMATNDADFTTPKGLVDIRNQFDDNGRYTGSESYLNSMVDLNAVDSIVHKVPWYSTRLLPLVESFLSVDSTSDSATATSATIGNTTTVTSSSNQTISTSIPTSSAVNKTSSAVTVNPSENGSTSPLAKGMAALIVGVMAMLL